MFAGKMIDIKTGEILLGDIKFLIFPLMSKEQFTASFPKDKILKKRDMGHGYVWFDIKGKIYGQKFPVELCFNPSDQLEFVYLYPQYSSGVNLKETTLKEWIENTVEETKFCNEWLLKNCGLQNKNNKFSYGEITSPYGDIISYYDPRSYSSGICIHYALKINSAWQG